MSEGFGKRSSIEIGRATVLHKLVDCFLFPEDFQSEEDLVI